MRGQYAHLPPEIQPGENYLHLTAKRGHPDPKFQWRSRYWSFLLNLAPDRPSPTLQAQPGANVGPFHWENAVSPSRRSSGHSPSQTPPTRRRPLCDPSATRELGATLARRGYIRAVAGLPPLVEPAGQLRLVSRSRPRLSPTRSATLWAATPTSSCSQIRSTCQPASRRARLTR